MYIPFSIFSQKDLGIIWAIFIHKKNRAELLNNMSKWSNHMHKQDVIRTVQLIGRYYSSLTDIVNQLNYCYSFQVRWRIFLLFFFELSGKYFSHRQLFSSNSGDDHHWEHFCEFGFHSLFISSKYNHRRSALQIFTLAPHHLADIFPNHHIDHNLCFRQRNERGLNCSHLSFKFIKSYNRISILSERRQRTHVFGHIVANEKCVQKTYELLCHPDWFFFSYLIGEIHITNHTRHKQLLWKCRCDPIGKEIIDSLCHSNLNIADQQQRVW